MCRQGMSKQEKLGVDRGADPIQFGEEFGVGPVRAEAAVDK